METIDRLIKYEVDSTSWKISKRRKDYNLDLRKKEISGEAKICQASKIL